MNCENCKHYEPNTEWNGECTIELPRWLVVSLKELHDDRYRFVRADSSCDLGEEK